MPKLSEIIEPFAATLGIPVKSMNVFAMVLRKNGLITKGGRGTAGAEMGPSDCTNLLLAAMLGGEAISVNERVARLRTARQRSVESTVPPVHFLRDDFGSTLDAIFEEIIEYGGLVQAETEFPITNMTLHVEQPSAFGTAASLWIDDGNTDGTIDFSRMGEVFENAPEDRWNDIARASRSNGIRVRSELHSDGLWPLADIIRGEGTVS